jgi:AcrR family transcriptional regulator
MSKGEETRQAVLERATELARTLGLDGLTIGKLADELRLSKSGLFAHFRSKENLQVEVIDQARREFVEEVIVPAFEAPRGEPRLRALFDRWVRWGSREGGCFFVAVSAELDDREGPVRDAAVAAQRDFLDTLEQAVRIAIDEGHFGRDLDPRAFVFELESYLLGFQFMGRFVREPGAERLTRRAVDALIERSRA